MQHTSLTIFDVEIWSDDAERTSGDENRYSESRKLISYLVWGATEAISSIRMNVFKVGLLDSAAASDFFLVFRGGVSSSDAHL